MRCASPRGRARCASALTGFPDWPLPSQGLALARAATAHSVRAVRGASARRRLGRVPARPARHRTSRCCGSRSGWRSSKAGGSIRPACRSHNLIHVEARDARDALWAMEEGVRCAALSAVIGEIWGDPAGARLHRDAAARGRVGAERRRLLAGAARRHRELERRADALADRERAVAAPIRSTRARRARRRGTPSCSARGARRRGGGASRMKRMLSIWLPGLAIERWAKSAATYAPDAPVVLTVEGAHGLIIHAVTKAAAERGARPGARLTDARALDPALVAVPADPDGRCRAAAAARAMGRALVAVGRGRWADGLRLDVSGVAHLFGGERGWSRISAAFAGPASRRASRLRRPRRRHGRWRAITLAPCGGGSVCANRRRGISGHSPSTLRCRLSRWQTRLTTAPRRRAAARSDTVRTLERLGLQDHRRAARHAAAGAGAAVPRGATDVVDALDRMLGRKPEPLTAAPDDPPPRAALRLEEPATHPEAAGQALERLIPGLVRQLRGAASRRAAAVAAPAIGSTAASPSPRSRPRLRAASPKHLQRLLAETRRRRSNPEFGFDAFALTADWTEPLGAAQDSLVEEPRGERDVARLVDRLTVKLGPRAVRRPRADESHVPERASGWVAAVLLPCICGGGSARSAAEGSPRTQPLRRLPLPSQAEGRRPPTPARPARSDRRDLCHARRHAAAVRVAARGA